MEPVKKNVCEILTTSDNQSNDYGGHSSNRYLTGEVKSEVNDNNIDFNQFIKGDWSDNDSFDYNQIKNESYNYLDEDIECEPHISNTIADSFDDAIDMNYISSTNNNTSQFIVSNDYKRIDTQSIDNENNDENVSNVDGFIENEINNMPSTLNTENELNNRNGSFQKLNIGEDLMEDSYEGDKVEVFLDDNIEDDEDIVLLSRPESEVDRDEMINSNDCISPMLLGFPDKIESVLDNPLESIERRLRFPDKNEGVLDNSPESRYTFCKEEISFGDSDAVSEVVTEESNNNSVLEFVQGDHNYSYQNVVIDKPQTSRTDMQLNKETTPASNDDNLSDRLLLLVSNLAIHDKLPNELLDQMAAIKSLIQSLRTQIIQQNNMVDENSNVNLLKTSFCTEPTDIDDGSTGNRAIPNEMESINEDQTIANSQVNENITNTNNLQSEIPINKEVIFNSDRVISRNNPSKDAKDATMADEVNSLSVFVSEKYSQPSKPDNRKEKLNFVNDSDDLSSVERHIVPSSENNNLITAINEERNDNTVVITEEIEIKNISVPDNFSSKITTSNDEDDKLSIFFSEGHPEPIENDVGLEILNISSCSGDRSSVETIPFVNELEQSMLEEQFAEKELSGKTEKQLNPNTIPLSTIATENITEVPLTGNTSVPIISDKLKENLKKLDIYGQNIATRNSKLMIDIEKLHSKNESSQSIYAEYILQLQSEFKDLVNDFRNITNTHKSKLLQNNFEKNAEERALAQENANKLNQKFKERWLASSSESSNAENSRSLIHIKKKRKRRRVPTGEFKLKHRNSMETDDDLIDLERPCQKLIYDRDSESDKSENSIKSNNSTKTNNSYNNQSEKTVNSEPESLNKLDKTNKNETKDFTESTDYTYNGDNEVITEISDKMIENTTVMNLNTSDNIPTTSNQSISDYSSQCDESEASDRLSLSKYLLIRSTDNESIQGHMEPQTDPDEEDDLNTESILVKSEPHIPKANISDENEDEMSVEEIEEQEMNSIGCRDTHINESDNDFEGFDYRDGNISYEVEVKDKCSVDRDASDVEMVEHVNEKEFSALSCEDKENSKHSPLSDNIKQFSPVNEEFCEVDDAAMLVSVVMDNKDQDELIELINVEKSEGDQIKENIPLNSSIEKTAEEYKYEVSECSDDENEDNNSNQKVKIEKLENDTAKEDGPEENKNNDAEENSENESEKESEADVEEDIDELNDKEIDRLLDFTTLNAQRTTSEVKYKSNKKPAKAKKNERLLVILTETTNNECLNDSNSESEEEIITEEQYLQQCNLRSKDTLLAMSSSDTELSNSSTENQEINAYSDCSNDSMINKFLKKKINNQIEETFLKQQNTDENSSKEEVQEKMLPVDLSSNEVYQTDTAKNIVTDVNDDKMQSVADQSNKEIDDKTSDENIIKKSNTEIKDEIENNTDDDEKKSRPANKRDKLDSSIFGKSLFRYLDDFIIKSDKEDDDITEKWSFDSDCEILDISMFKYKQNSKTMDDYKMAKILKNTKKPSTTKSQPSDCISLSSDSNLDLEEVAGGDEEDEEEKRRVSRRMLRTDQLAGETKMAQREEAERVKRLEKKTERLSQIISQSQQSQQTQSPEESDIILDYDSKKKINITVHSDIVKYLKPHQVDGVKFMYDTCYGSVDSIDKFPGSGCILAHCMGLGKTLQLIALLHTLIRHTQLKTNKILVICPKSTVMNWADEIRRWLGPVKSGPTLKVYHFPDSSDINEKLRILRNWHNSGQHGYTKAGCLLIGYEAFRTLVFYHLQKKRVMSVSQSKLDIIKKKIEETLLKPGADLVICDEGHMIKNRKSGTSIAVNEIRTKRRIILTGTPIQNNLKEYYSMVNFIKPSFLGTEKEFANLYANPIKSGQHKDSSKGEIKFMKQRSYVLHKKLSKFVQRREAALLKTFLPEKYEYVLYIPMTEVQNRLYEYFLENNPLKEKYGGKSLIPDYTFLRKIWTHPKVLEIAWQNAMTLQQKKDATKPKRSPDSEDDQPDDVLDSQVGKMSVTSDWWREFVAPEDLESLLPSNKLRILFEILKLCTENGEKVLIFSAFVAVLNVVEHFMKQIHIQGEFAKKYGFDRFRGPWVLGHDYYRLDGKTAKSIRHSMITSFNNPANTRTKCFLISAKAGGQGINLIGSNRVIILDTSWNPSNDQQNIFRVFRLGQKSKCYIYRLLAMGTMEEKVYSRSVTKQAMSFRVVDEQQIDRHYSMAELTELYTLTKPDYNERPTPIRPYDFVLASMLHNFPDLVYKYHEHDSLLEKNTEQDLSEEEKADAWAAYENDVSMKKQFNNMAGMTDGLFNSPPPYGNMGLPSFAGGSLLHPFGPNFLPGTNISPNLLSNYMNIPYPPGIEKDLLMMSQMYNSPYSNILASSASGSRGAVGGLNLSSNYGTLFGQGSSGNNMYNPGSIMPTSTTSNSPYSQNNVSSIFSSGNLSSITSPSFGQNSTSNLLGPGGLIPTTSSAIQQQQQQQQQNVLSNLSNYLPSFSNMKLPSNTSSSSLNSTTSTSSRPSISAQKASTIREIDKSMWNYLNSSALYPSDLSSAKSANTNIPSMPNLQPGPNAIKNPMLSKELSMPSLVPVANNTKDGFILPSIPTSVITKTSNLPAATSKDIARTINMSTNRTSPGVNRGSLGVNRTNPITSNVAGNRTSQAVSILGNNRNNVAANNMTLNHSTPATISIGGNRTSPEPHIIVKNVNAINQSINKAPTPGTKLVKPSPTPIKNFNMGIVYPKKDDNTKFDLTHNNSILKTARSQLHAIANNTTSIQTITPRPLPTMQPLSRGKVASTKVVSSTVVNRNVTTSAPTVIQNPTYSTTLIRRPKDVTPLTSKHIINLPNNISSDVTISSTGKKVSNASGLTISPVPAINKPNITYSRISNTNTGQKVQPKVLTPQLIKQQQSFNTAKNILQKSNQVTKTINQPNNVTTPQKRITSVGVTRQNSAPIITGNITTAQARPINNQSTNISMISKQQKVPPLVRQSTVPLIKTISQTTGPSIISNIKQSAKSPQIITHTIGSTNVGTKMISKPMQSLLGATTITNTTNRQQSQNQSILRTSLNGNNQNVVTKPTQPVVQRITNRLPASTSAVTTSNASNNTMAGVRKMNIVTSVTPKNVVTRMPLKIGASTQQSIEKPISSTVNRIVPLQRKRKISELIPTNSSISITEIKKPKLSTPATSSVKRDVRQSIKKINSFDGVTILPRNSQKTQNSQSQRDESMEIVELD